MQNRPSVNPAPEGPISKLIRTMMTTMVTPTASTFFEFFSIDSLNLRKQPGRFALNWSPFHETVSAENYIHLKHNLVKFTIEMMPSPKSKVIVQNTWMNSYLLFLCRSLFKIWD
jgi:hypothetical protein